LSANALACQWTYDEHHDAWDTTCGNKYQFMHDGPKENGIKFCPFCGIQLNSDPVPKLALKRAVCIFDIESTGTDVAMDRIITLAIKRIDPPDLFHAEEQVTKKTWMVNPKRAIPPDSTRIHGITDAMVKDCPYFEDVAEEVKALLSGADFCGYNLLKFDVPLLWEEFYRCNIELDLADVKIVDASEIFRKKVPRNLEAAVERFCGREHIGAHDAMGDVEETWNVLNGQRATYPDLAKMTLGELAQFSMEEEWEGKPAKRLDLAGYVIQDWNGVARYTLRKVQGIAVYDDTGFADWMLRNSFPMNTKMVLRKLLGDA
jgi:DNA polymerase-3 subunit epsilon